MAQSAAEKLKEEANSLYSKKQYKEAIHFYLRAHEKDPENPVYHSNIAACYIELGVYDRGVVACDESLKHFIHERDTDDEMKDVDCSLVSPSASSTLRAKVFCRRGKCLFYLQRWKEAKESLEKATKLFPDIFSSNPPCKEMYDFLISDNRTMKNSSGLDWANIRRTFPLHRCSASSIFCELHAVGQDSVTSALGSIDMKSQQGTDRPPWEDADEPAPTSQFRFPSEQIEKQFEEDKGKGTLSRHLLNDNFEHRTFPVSVQTEGPFRIKLSECSDDQLSRLSFLFGGVGDGRHFWMTLVDLFFQLAELESNGRHDEIERIRRHLKLRFALNDISHDIIARQVFSLKALTILGDDLRDSLSLPSPSSSSSSPWMASSFVLTEKQTLLMSLLYYLTLSPFVPTALEEPLREIVTSLLNQSHDSHAYVNFPGGDSSYQTLSTVWRKWLTPSHNIGDIFDNYHPAKDEKEHVDEIIPSAASAVRKADSKQQKDSIRNSLMCMEEKQIDEMLALFQGPRPKTKMTLQEKRNFLVEITSPVLDEMSTSTLNSRFKYSTLSQAMIEETKLLPIPRELCQYLLGHPQPSSETSLGAFVPANHDLKKKNPFSIEDALSAYLKGDENPFDPLVMLPYFLNPTCISTMDGRELPQQSYCGYEPTEILSSYYLPNIILDPPKPAKNMNADYYYLLFKNMLEKAAVTLSWLISNNSIEVLFDLGDLHSLPLRCEKPVTFTRIFANNIPDYTSTLSILTDLASFLDPSDPNHLMLTNIMLNVPLFDSIDCYIHSSTFVPSQAQLPEHLGVKMVKGSLWGDWICYQRCPPRQWSEFREQNHSLPITKESFELWVIQILITIVFPNSRNTNAAYHEIRPWNIQRWFHLLSHLISLENVPRHWIADVVETVLLNKLTTKAQRPSSSPCAPAFSLSNLQRKPARFDLSPFLPELQVFASLWLNSVNLQLPRVLASPGWENLLNASEVAVYKCKAFSLLRYFVHSEGSAGLLVYSSDWNGASPKKRTWESPITDYLSNPNKRVGEMYLFSSLDWRIDAPTDGNIPTESSMEKSTATILLTRSLYSQLVSRNCVAVVVRTDSYETVTTVVPLSQFITE
jgi:hypothetical protein